MAHSALGFSESCSVQWQHSCSPKLTNTEETRLAFWSKVLFDQLLQEEKHSGFQVCKLFSWREAWSRLERSSRLRLNTSWEQLHLSITASLQIYNLWRVLIEVRKMVEVNFLISTWHCDPALWEKLTTKLCSSASTLVSVAGRKYSLFFAAVLTTKVLALLHQRAFVH